MKSKDQTIETVLIVIILVSVFYLCALVAPGIPMGQ